MVSRRSIVVGFDGSAAARDALSWSLEEARRSDCRVDLVCAFEWHVFVEPVSTIATVLPERVARARTQAMLDATAAKAARAYPDVPVDAVMVDGQAEEVLGARSSRARLLVVGCRGCGGFTGLRLGATALTVAARAECPVVVVRSRAEPAEPPGPVLVGVDASPGSQLALAFAFEQAAARGAGLHVVRVFSRPMGDWNIGGTERPASWKAAHAELVARWNQGYPTVTFTADAVTVLPHDDPPRRHPRRTAGGGRRRRRFGTRRYWSRCGKSPPSALRPLPRCGRPPSLLVRATRAGGRGSPLLRVGVTPQEGAAPGASY